MPARRRVSVRQLEILVEFAESHRDIALGRFSGGPQGVRDTREAWRSIAVQLSSVAEGSTKTPDQWRRYWIEFKAKVKAKAADSRRNATATGGGPNKLVPLTDLEQRVLAIVGKVAVEGFTEDRQHNSPPPTLPSQQRSTPPPRRSRSQRQFRRHDGVPRWAYEIEEKRIANDERIATAMEAMVELLKEIKDYMLK